MLKFMHKFLSSDKGTTAIEYGLIAALIVVTIVSAVQALGQAIVTTLYNKLALLF